MQGLSRTGEIAASLWDLAGRRPAGPPAAARRRLAWPAPADRALAAAALLNAGFVVAEIACGLLAHSDALLADATHNLGDALGLLLAWGAAALGRRAPNRRWTYGYGRCSILAALANAIVLLLGVGGIVANALHCLFHGAPSCAVDGRAVVLVAAAGIVVNGTAALLLARGRAGDLNLRCAFRHMTADAAVSAVVVTAGLAILLTGRTWIDPAASLVTAAVIFATTWSLLRDSVDLALDKVPAGIDAAAVEACLAALPGVVAVHHLHIWALSTTETALTAHLVRPQASTDDRLLRMAGDALRRRFAIRHVTLQLEARPVQPSCAARNADIRCHASSVQAAS